MPTPASWREVLKSVIEDPHERERIAKAVNVSTVTLNRWGSGESHPRPRNLGQLQRTFPVEKRAQFMELIRQEYGDTALPEHVGASLVDRIDYAFLRHIWHARATTSLRLLFWTVCGQVLEHAVRQLDPGQVGLCISVVQCVPPVGDGKVFTLRETRGRGTSPWPAESPNYSLMFLGAESLAGYAVSCCSEQIIDDLREPAQGLQPSYRTAHEVSAIAQPIMYANRIAGSLLCSCTLPGYFRLEARRSLIADYTQLVAQSLPLEQFFAPEQIGLQIMPPLEVQQAKFATFQQRVTDLMQEENRRSRFLTRQQAEARIWQQFAEELLLSSLVQEER
jgi:hypothetical protein